MPINEGDAVLIRTSIILAIFIKDIRQYYGKAPTISWGLLFPATLIVLLGYYGAGLGSYRVIPSLLGITLLFSGTSMTHVAMGFDKASGGIETLIHSPIHPVELLIAKIMGGVIFGLLGVSIGTAILWGLYGSLQAINPVFLWIGIIFGSIIFSLLGLLISSVLDVIQAVMVLNALRFLMIFLGGMLPKELLPEIVQPLAYILPISYVNDLIRYGIYNLFDYVDPISAAIIAVIYTIVLLLIVYRVIDKCFNP